MNTLKQLCLEYEASDSISRREELAEEIEKLVRVYLNKLYTNALKIRESTRGTMFDMTDFRDDRGYLTLDDIWTDKVVVRYRDSWGYGGSCDEKFAVEFEDYEKFNEAVYTKSLKDKNKKEIRNQISSLKSQIKRLEKKLEKL